MKKIAATALAAALGMSLQAASPEFDTCFDGRTLRLDYVMGGTDSVAAIYLERAGVSPGWAGRRHHLDRPWCRGNGAVTVKDRQTGDTLYTNSFSTLFQEWQHTPEAAHTARCYESTFLVPFPRSAVDVTVELYDNRGNTVASMTHPVDPADIQIRVIPPAETDHRYIYRGGSPEECVDIAVVAEGYTAAETEKFYTDAERAAEALLSHEPFASMKERFNIVAVASVAGDSGPDVPREGVWNRTAHGSHYDTFYSDRYLTTSAIHDLFDSVDGLPVEHIILMVNTPRYGGGGIFNQLTVCSSDHPTFKQVLVHEFGHAYAGLADEYYYADDSDTTYPADVEPWEPNITTLVDFGSKWADMVDGSVAVPTPTVEAGDVRSLNPDSPADAALLKKLTSTVGVYEGAGYRPHGIYRPVQECRMKVNEVGDFCPVCTRAITSITDWYTRP